MDQEPNMQENTEMQTEEVVADTPASKNIIIVVVLAVIVVVLALVYLWGSGVQAPAPEQAPEEVPVAEVPVALPADEQVEVLKTVSVSDELEAIESDISSTDLESIDIELNSIESELESALQE
jgi:flagellar basal body-associated protein FliL